MNQPDPAEIEAAAKSVRGYLDFTAQIGGDILFSYRGVELRKADVETLLAALATAEQAAEDLAEDRANWRAESKGYEAELAAAEAVVEAAEQMVDAIDEKPSLEWVAYASSLNDALNAYHKATGPQAETEQIAGEGGGLSHSPAETSGGGGAAAASLSPAQNENAQPGATGEGS